MRMTGTRWALLAMAVVAAVALWQTHSLSMWSFNGPGPGLFPRAVAIAAILLCAICFFFPERKSEIAEDDGVVDFRNAGAGERRTFWLYLAGTLLLIPATLWAGFFLTAIGIIVFLMVAGERTAWKRAVVYSVIVAIVGLVCFGRLLHVDLPASEVDRFLLSLLR